MVARRFLSWPSDIKPITQQDRQRLVVNRTTESTGGINDSAEFRTAQKRSYQNDFVIPNESSYDWKNKWMWLAPQIKGQAGRIWFQEPSERWYEKIRSGPPANGTREVFPVPIQAASDGPHMYVNGEWDSAALIQPGRSNLLTDNQAISDTDLTGLLPFGTCTLARASAYRYYYGNSIQVNPTGTTSNFGYRTFYQTCPPTWPVTALGWFTGPTALSVEVRLGFYDALQVLIGTVATSSPVALVPGEWTPIHVSASSPANTAYVQTWGVCLSSTSLPWWSDCRGAMLFADPWWWLPSEAPLAGLLSSPPAAPTPSTPSLVEVAGAGLWQVLGMPQQDAVDETERPQGHIFPSLDLVEVWEPAGSW